MDKKSVDSDQMTSIEARSSRSVLLLKHPSFSSNITSQQANSAIPDPKLKRKLEDLKVLRRSPDLLNNVKIGQGQLQLIMKQILFYRILGLQPFWSSDLNNPMNTPSNSPVISEEKMFR